MSVEPIQRLILELGRLPGIGERSAARLAYYIIKASRERQAGEHTLARDLAAALVDVNDQVGLCETCQNLCTGERCSICADPRRDSSLVCVVEGVADLRAIEQSGAHRGTYHVLHGALAPLEGRGPSELKITELTKRVQGGAIQEIILATNANVEGDATSLYLARIIKPLGVKVTRLASGIPLGGELEFLDQATLGRALADRKDF